MTQSRYKVLLYLDESRYSLSAALYSAMLMTNIPNMHLTVVKLKESNHVSNHEINEDWLNSWLSTSEWMRDALNIFSERSGDIRKQVIYCNPNIPDTVEALLNYARKSSIDLLIMGTGDLNKLKGLLFGSLAYSLQSSSSIPILLVKELSQDFFEENISKSRMKLVHKN